MEIPVYMFLGFLDSGKTTFIQETLEDKRFNSGEKTLLLVCEEGETEYDPSKFYGKNVKIEVIDDVADITTENLTALCKKANAERVVVEYNGMWPLAPFVNAAPENWSLYQSMMFADSGTFMTYNANMRNLVVEKINFCELVAFNRPFMEKTHPVGQIAALTAKCEIKYGKYQSTSFELEKIADSGELSAFTGIEVPNSKVFPIYPLTEGLTNKILSKTIQAAFKQFSLGLENDLPPQIIEKRHLLSKKEAIRQIHFPKTLSEAIGARNTLVFEELFLFQKTLAERAIAHRGKLPRIEVDTAEDTQKQVSEEEFAKNLSTRQKNLLARLPYKLTPDQMSVIALMNEDIDRNYGFGKDGWREGIGSDGVAGKTCETGFERVSVKATPEPSPAERVAANEVGARGRLPPAKNFLKDSEEKNYGK